MNRLTIIHEKRAIGQSPHVVAVINEAGETIRQVTGAASHAAATGAAAQEVIKDLDNNEARFTDVLINAAILDVAIKQVRMADPPDKARKIGRLETKRGQWERWEREQQTIAEADAIKEQRAAERQAALDEQAEKERKAAENSEHARRAKLPHELLIGLYSPMDTLPTHDPAREIYLILRWYPEDDSAGPPREIERLTINEALKWQMEKAAVSENRDGDATPHVSPFRPVTRLRNPEANW